MSGVADDSTDDSALIDALPRESVIAAIVPHGPHRVLREAARYAELTGAHLLVVHVDPSRMVAFDDPDGFVHATSLDLSVAARERDFDDVRAVAGEALAGSRVAWTPVQMVGDPATEIAHLAARNGSRLIVVGTRRRGIGESIREFLTGSVAARLAHRQPVPVLVVPLGTPAADDDLWPDL